MEGPQYDAPSRQATFASQTAEPPLDSAAPSERGTSGGAETIVDGESAQRDLGPGLKAGEKIGRYVAIEKLGAGGMGVVWAAYDPKLDRRVAVKLLRPDGRSAKKREVARLRLQREAQAMAKLSHPNVVAVFDVGEHEGQIFLAMAYLGGGTLKAAMDASDWTWQRALEVYCAAGDGLAAAHQAGLVHRDFKPDNVILDTEGRPKVVDFGLVRATDTAEFDPEEEESADTHTSGALSTSVTRVGAVMGTPAYMAPEQHMGRDATPASDQFGFCVALYEGLYGRHPFAANSLIALAQRVLSGEIEAPPGDSSVPSYVREAVLRGLHPDPKQRFANMNELLSALRSDRSGLRRAWLGGIAMAAIAVALAAFAFKQSETDAACTGAADKLDLVWGVRAHARLDEAFGASRLPYAADTLERTTRFLDDWGRRWTSGRRDACEATEVRKEQSVDLMDRRVACLDTQLRALSARVDLLAEGEASDIELAVDIVTDLPAPERCADTEALLRADARPRGPQYATIADEIERAHTDQLGHHFERAHAQTTKALEAARAAEERELEARARYQLGFLELAMTKPLPAAENLEAAGWLAVELDLPELAARAWLTLLEVTGDRLGKDDQWPRWERAARASLARVDGDSSYLLPHLDNAIGSVHERNGRPAEAKTWYQRALDGAGGLEDPGSLRLHLMNNLGIAHLNLGEGKEAIAILEQARVGYVERYGPEHPDVAAALQNLGNALEVTGSYERAIETHRESLRILSASMPEDHLDLAAAHDNLGNSLDGAGQTEAAIEHISKALAMRERSMGGEDPTVGISANNLGDALMRLGRMDEAIPHVERACKAFEKGYGPEHPNTGICLNNLARIRHHQGRSQEALSTLDRAMGIHAEAFGADHPILAYHLVERGRVLRDQGRKGPAIEALERAVKLRDEGEEEAMLVAEACFELAQTLSGAKRERAVALAERARDNYKSAGGAAQKELAEVQAWLSAQAG